MLHAIIPAGGAGTRLWPLSRANAPKFLATTGGDQTLLEQTWTRLGDLVDSITIVTGQNHLDAVTGLVAKTTRDGVASGILAGGVEVIGEPSPRNTMPAIGLAAAIIEHRHGDVVIGSFAADQVVRDEPQFRTVVQRAVAAAQAGYITTIGITPTGPATGYGYIAPGADTGTWAEVDQFVEKPDSATAATYCERGYLWNAGMFIARAGVLLDELGRELPQLAAGLRQIAAAWDGPDRDRVLAEVWPGLTRIAIDHAVAEPAAARGKVAVVAADVGWSDVGDFETWSDYVPSAPHQAIDAPGSWVGTTTQHVAIVGIPDAIVVATPDAILVTTRASAQRVGEVPKQLPPDSAYR